MMSKVLYAFRSPNEPPTDCDAAAAIVRELQSIWRQAEALAPRGLFAWPADNRKASELGCIVKVLAAIVPRFLAEYDRLPDAYRSAANQPNLVRRPPDLLDFSDEVRRIKGLVDLVYVQLVDLLGSAVTEAEARERAALVLPNLRCGPCAIIAKEGFVQDRYDTTKTALTLDNLQGIAINLEKLSLCMSASKFADVVARISPPQLHGTAGAELLRRLVPPATTSRAHSPLLDAISLQMQRLNDAIGVHDRQAAAAQWRRLFDHFPRCELEFTHLENRTETVVNEGI